MVDWRWADGVWGTGGCEKPMERWRNGCRGSGAQRRRRGSEVARTRRVARRLVPVLANPWAHDWAGRTSCQWPMSAPHHHGSHVAALQNQQGLDPLCAHSAFCEAPGRGGAARAVRGCSRDLLYVREKHCPSPGRSWVGGCRWSWWWWLQAGEEGGLIHRNIESERDKTPPNSCFPSHGGRKWERTWKLRARHWGQPWSRALVGAMEQGMLGQTSPWPRGMQTETPCGR